LQIRASGILSPDEGTLLLLRLPSAALGCRLFGFFMFIKYPAAFALAAPLAPFLHFSSITKYPAAAQWLAVSF
jgi:hypothetical protein